MGDTSETNTKVLSRELFLGVVSTKTPISKNHYLRDKDPFLRYGHIYLSFCNCSFLCKKIVSYISCSTHHILNVLANSKNKLHQIFYCTVYVR